MSAGRTQFKTEICVSATSIVALLPAQFGLLGEVLEMQESIEGTLKQNENVNEVVLDFTLVRDLEQSFPSRIEKFIERLESKYPAVAVCWQNVGEQVQGYVSTVQFGRGQEKDPPVELTSKVGEEAALTSVTRMEQNDIDDLFASLGAV